MDEPVPASEERVKIVASTAGGLLAQIETGHLVVLALPDLAPVAEIGIPGDLDDHDVAFVGTRLVVLSRATGESVLHLIDPIGPNGPSKLGELKFRGTARIAASTGTYVLVIAGQTALVVDVGKAAPSANALPLRGAITAAGTAGASFLVCVGGVLEEWDAATRKPARRLRVDPAVDPWFIGGNEHRVWIVSRRQPDQLDVVNLEKRSSRRITLPEPVGRVVPHHAGGIVVAIAADSARAWLVYVARQHDQILPIEQTVDDLAWLGRGYTLALRPTDAAIGLLSVPSGDDEIPPIVDGEAPAPTAAPPPPVARSAVDDARSDPPPAQWTREDIAARLAAWRERVSERAREPGDEPAESVAALSAPLPLAPATHDVHPGGWRGELASWARTVCARSYRAMPRLDCGVLDDVAHRLELGEQHREALALLYGAYLNGGASIAPIVLASVVGWRWQEALGAGRLADSGAVRWRRGQIGLYPEVIAALDEREPLLGTLALGARDADRLVAIVAAPDRPLAELAAWAAAQVGTLFVPDPDAKPRRFLLEAKVRHLAPIVRGGSERPARGVLVVADASEAPAGTEIVSPPA